MVLIHGGPLDVAWMEESDRIDAVLTAWFPGQVSIDMLQYCVLVLLLEQLVLACILLAGHWRTPSRSRACLSLKLAGPTRRGDVVERLL